jgi:prepilin-type N-terminal cleavage/methylation domain-containing protein
MCKPKSFKKEQGFTLVEVLVAILIATIFVTVTMQMIVIATIFKVKAQENAEATNWIQEDLENIRYKAGNLQFPLRTSLSANATAGTNSISVYSTTGLDVDDTLKIGLDSSKYTIETIIGTTLTISPALATNQVIDAAIAETTMCSAVAATLRANVNGINTYVDNPPSSGNNQSTTGTALSSKLSANKKYSLRRTTTINNNSPNVLQLKYEVSPGTTFDATKKIASFYTEVIPNVAFQCP